MLKHSLFGSTSSSSSSVVLISSANKVWFYSVVGSRIAATKFNSLTTNNNNLRLDNGYHLGLYLTKKFHRNLLLNESTSSNGGGGLYDSALSPSSETRTTKQATKIKKSSSPVIASAPKKVYERKNTPIITLDREHEENELKNLGDLSNKEKLKKHLGLTSVPTHITPQQRETLELAMGELVAKDKTEPVTLKKKKKKAVTTSKARDEQIIKEKLESTKRPDDSGKTEVSSSSTHKDRQHLSLMEAPNQTLQERFSKKNSQSLTSTQIVERTLDTHKFDTDKPETLVPFKSPRLIKLWKEGKIVPENIRNRLRFQETPEGLFDIYFQDDPGFTKLTNTLLTPTSTFLQLEKLKMLSEETDPELFFKSKPLTIKNFNYLIRCQAIQGQLELAEKTFEKLKSLGPSKAELEAIIQKRKASLLNDYVHDDTLYLIPSEYTFAAIMQACAAKGEYKKAYGYLREMQQEYQISPNVVSYSIVVHAMIKAGKIDEAFQMVEVMRSHNLPTDTVLHTDLIKGCIETGDVERAWNHYMAMGIVYGVPHDEVTITVMIDACAIKGQAEKAMMLFRRLEEQMMAEPSEATFNSLIKAFSKRKDLRHKAFEIADRMELQGFKPDIYTINSLINACADDGDVSRMKKVLKKMKDCGIKPTEHTYNSVLSCYSTAQQVKGNNNLTKEQNQNIVDALAVFEKMKESNLPITNYTLNALFGVFTNAARINRAEEFFAKTFQENQLVPDSISYALLVRMYCRTKRTEKAMALFDEMKEKGIIPTYQAFKHMVFKLVDEGYVEKARDYLRQMFEVGGFKLSPSDIIKYKSRLAGAARLIKERKQEENIDEYIKTFVDLVDYDLDKPKESGNADHFNNNTPAQNLAKSLASFE
ncbi:hypothetical protein FDP41_008305 [Naegleria fowleri]|uniref:PROP1-like PPR domain-containing protein n=1 Tax=Naegleria fowleri TaxID=5763 RepID=A0A6A5BGJ0_NAEFO|nr:uncharacterized protein FDP41_008305 [Naegleria fowleri]KAF0973601.1 hypothetical protein FDP41_008305 [Naegleria fowleri]